MQRCRITVVFHDLTENPVYCMYDVSLTSEIPVQINPGAADLLLFSVNIITLLKDFLFRLTEFINALFNISNKKQIIFPANQIDQSILQHITVLILIYKDAGKFIPVFSRRFLML